MQDYLLKWIVTLFLLCALLIKKLIKLFEHDWHIFQYIIHSGVVTNFSQILFISYWWTNFHELYICRMLFIECCETTVLIEFLIINVFILLPKLFVYILFNEKKIGEMIFIFIYFSIWNKKYDFNLHFELID